MPNIKARIGPQNVIKVLANTPISSTKLIDLTDVNSILKSKDGMILVWDLETEKFYMTDTIDSSSLVATGIVSFSNSENSISPTTGALVVNGGIGIGKNVTVGGGLSIIGISTFESDIDVNAAIDILKSLTVNSTFKSVGVTTLSSSGGITTTGGDIFVGKNLNVKGTSEFIGVSTFKNNLNISGDVTITGFASVTEGIYYDFDDYNGSNGIAYFDNSGKLVGAASTENSITETYFILTTNSVGIPTWTSTIDGGEY